MVFFDFRFVPRLAHYRARGDTRPYILDFIRWIPYEKEMVAPLEIAPSYLEEQLESIKKTVDTEPVDAELIMENHVPVVNEGKNGVSLDIRRSREIVLTYVEAGRYEQIPLSADKIRPAVTEEDLPDFTQRLAYYETPLDLLELLMEKLKLSTPKRMDVRQSFILPMKGLPFHNGDVDLESGNIRFTGDIRIYGNVMEGI